MSDFNKKLAELEARAAELSARMKTSALGFVAPMEEEQPFFDELCQTYAGGNRLQRIQLRNLLQDREGLQNRLMAFIYICKDALLKTGDSAWLAKGCAAAALEAGHQDYRDTLLARAKLFVAAEQIGIDPKPAFADILGLDDFEQYAVVQSARRRVSGRKL